MEGMLSTGYPLARAIVREHVRAMDSRWIDAVGPLAILRLVPAKKPAPRPIAANNPNRAATVLRLDPALVAALDAWVARLNDGNEGPQWTRTTLIRAALQRAVRERAAKGEAP